MWAHRRTKNGKKEVCEKRVGCRKTDLSFLGITHCVFRKPVVVNILSEARNLFGTHSGFHLLNHPILKLIGRSPVARR
jgi:hypothetical protein